MRYKSLVEFTRSLGSNTFPVTVLSLFLINETQITGFIFYRVFHNLFAIFYKMIQSFKIFKKVFKKKCSKMFHYAAGFFVLQLKIYIT